MRANGVLIHWRWFRAYGNVIGGARPPGRSGPIQWNVVIYIKWPWIGAFLRCWFRLILYICEQFVYMCTMHRIIRSLLGGGCQWNFRKMMYFNAWKRPCRPARIGWDPKISPIEMPFFYHFSAGKTKSTDVLPREVRCFGISEGHILPVFFHFLRNFRVFRVKMVLKSFADVPKILRKSPYLALKTPKCVLEPVRNFVKII